MENDKIHVTHQLWYNLFILNKNWVCVGHLMPAREIFHNLVALAVGFTNTFKESGVLVHKTTFPNE